MGPSKFTNQCRIYKPRFLESMKSMTVAMPTVMVAVGFWQSLELCDHWDLREEVS